MQILAIILQVLLGLAFLGAGGQKLAASEEMVNDFERFGYPRWFLYATGAVEITGAIGMLAGIFVPLVGALAGMWLAAVMLGALFKPSQKMSGAWLEPVGSPQLLVSRSASSTSRVILPE
jgi:uncharacterized membrane protein YphA (DoxX/SURF4 family)